MHYTTRRRPQIQAHLAHARKPYILCTEYITLKHNRLVHCVTTPPLRRRCAIVAGRIVLYCIYIMQH